MLITNEWKKKMRFRCYRTSNSQFIGTLEYIVAAQMSYPLEGT